MIALGSDFLLVEMAGGETIPCSADTVCIEVEGDAVQSFDPEFVNHATKAVFHYFSHELGRRAVSAQELAEALEKVLQGFALPLHVSSQSPSQSRVLESDLRRLAHDSGQGCELAFFPRLRAELRRHLQREPRVLRFLGLRACVKHLAGARRWSERCRALETEIVAYLRECLTAEAAPGDLALLVE